MDDFKRSRPTRAHTGRSFDAAAKRPTPEWNPVTRQWWVPPVSEKEQVGATASEPKPAAVERPAPKRRDPAHHVNRPKKTTVTINFRLPYHISKEVVMLAIKNGPKRPRNRIGKTVYDTLRIGRWPRYSFSILSFALVFVLLLEVAMPFLDHRWQSTAYALSTDDMAVVAKTDDDMAANLKFDSQSSVFNFAATQATQLDGGNAVTGGGTVMSATIAQDITKGVSITDAQTQAEIKISPLFGAMQGRQNKNQVSFPIDGSKTVIYTAQASGIKEDILLKQRSADTLRFKYKLGLGVTYAARILNDGSLGIYGSSTLPTTISTSTAQDAALAKKLQQQSKKDKLLFIIPAPTIRQAEGPLASGVKATYSLKNDELTVTAVHLKKANYPLSIDPTVQISTTAEFYRNTSVESNADFNVTGNKITRGALTGGTPNSWTNGGNSLNQARFLAGATAFNGYMYVVGGVGGTTTSNITGSNTNMVEYSQISATDPSIAAATYSQASTGGTVSSPSTLGSWLAGNNSGLPSGGLSRFQLVGYKGFLYAIGGSTTDDTCSTLSTTVYYASVQVNGVLSNWSTTDAPGTARCDFGLAAYNGKIYIAGGKTASTATGTADVSYATVNPDGTLTWTNSTLATGAPNNTNAVNLPAARYGGDMQAYNGYLYMVGGNLNGTLTNTVLYVALNDDGTIYGTGTSNWLSTNVFTTARENFGGTYTTVKNGYIYLSGGCKTVVSATSNCSSSADSMSDNQLAQINADGSLGQWATTTSLTGARVGGAEIAWRGTIYSLFGCVTTGTTSLTCATTLAANQYATVNTPGQASVLTRLVSTASPNQILPISVFGSSAAVLNGYIYVVGGCITNTCGSGNPNVTNQTYYAPIQTDGTLGSWANTSTATINGTGLNSGVAETSLVAANGNLYAFGGYYDGGTTGDLATAWTVTPSASTGALPGAWTSMTGGIGTARHAVSAIYYKGSFLLFGGCIASGGFGCSSYSQLVTRYTVSGTTLTSGGNLTNQLPTSAGAPNAAMGLAFYNNRVYLCGGAASAQGQTQRCIYTTLSLSGANVDDSAWSFVTALLNYEPGAVSTANHPIRRNQAYAANGYLYVFSGHDGQNNVSIGTINIGKIASGGDIAQSDMTISTTQFTAKWDTASAFANGNIYTVGGCIAGNPPTTCSSRDNHTEYFQIYNATNSATRSVASTTALGTAYTGVAAAAYKGYLYLAGGCNSFTGTNCGSTTTTTQYSAINPDGSLAASFTNGPALGQARGFGCMVALNGSLYYIGGYNNGPPQPDVYISNITSGVPGSFTTSTALGTNRGATSCATYNNRIYVVGGQTGNAIGNVSNNYYYSSSLPSGGTTISWTLNSSNTFTTARSYLSVVAVAGYLYVMGGFDGSNTLGDVQFSQINTSTGDLGTWTFANDLPYKMRAAAAYAANGYIYLMGGSTGASTGCLNTTYVASVGSSGYIGAWTQGVATSFSARFGIGTAYYNGYYYMIGGADCTATPVIQTTNYYTGEQSQAIRSIFTRYIDLVGDATPQKFVINGGNAQVNGIDIDYWRMRYQSCRIGNVGSGFGTVTSNTNLPFGPNPFTMTAYNTSGVDEGVARYWSITFDIDQSQSFAFIDSTQPAITAYSFYYSPSGNTRLRNGRIFQDQTKQGLDAHP
ncbi:MAG: hypothetical protein JWO41_958 [Candidatus Saccharibacteria bacterium]|nr:hypothetical protein [Candidatus Saccharibacteria bacterium]